MNEVAARVEQRVNSLGLTPDNFLPNEKTELTLSEMSRFLRGLKITELGQIAIIERSGKIVASSSPELPLIQTAEGPEQIQAIESGELLIRQSINYLQVNHQGFPAISQSQGYSFKLNSERQFLQVRPIADGLNWLVLVVIPERAFMAEVNGNIRRTIFLCLGALVLAISIASIVSEFLGQQIRQLREANHWIAQGKIDPMVDQSSVKELAILRDSFNEMVWQIQDSFDKVKADCQALEQEVAEQNTSLEREIRDRQIVEQQLHTSEKKMRAFFEAMNDIIIVFDTDGNIEIAPTNPSALYDPDVDIIGLTIEHFFQADNFIELQDKIQQVLKIQKTLNFDYRLYLESQERWFTARVSPMSENSVIWVARDISDRKEAELALHLAQQQSESLLLNILPKPIAEQLKQSTEAIADHFDAATILFSDIVGFTPLSARLSALELVKLLNDMFSKFDRLAETYKLEKIKTIGDAYMVASGLPLPQKDHADAIAEMALDMQVAIHNFSKQHGEEFQIRIGIHSGPVVAGVIGKKKFIYDLWGDTVNVASRMESSGTPGKIQVTAETYQLLQDRYIFEKRGQISVKGKGEMITYWLIDRKLDKL